ncbi:hypothetical protein D3C80_1398040 [compost metagenome]
MQRDDVSVGYPARCGNDDFIARFQRCEKHVEQDLLGAIGDHHLVGGVIQSVFRLELLHDRLTQAFHSRGRAVAYTALADRFNGSFRNMRWRFEVRLAQ